MTFDDSLTLCNSLVKKVENIHIFPIYKKGKALKKGEEGVECT